MEKEILTEFLRTISENDQKLIEKFSKRIKEEDFLKSTDEVFTYEMFVIGNTKFTILKDITENMKKVYKNFLYAFEIKEGNDNGTKIGFFIKPNKNTYTIIYASTLESLIDLYYQKDTKLKFAEKEFIANDEGKIILINNDFFNTKEIEYFKSKCYYNIFKDEYLNQYINKSNLRLRKIVTNIFD